MWGYMPIILALVKEGCHKFTASLGYIATFCLKTLKNKKICTRKRAHVGIVIHSGQIETSLSGVRWCLLRPSPAPRVLEISDCHLFQHREPTMLFLASFKW